MLFKTHFKVTTLCIGLTVQAAIVLAAQRIEDFSLANFGVEVSTMLAFSVADLAVRALAVIGFASLIVDVQKVRLARVAVALYRSCHFLILQFEQVSIPRLAECRPLCNPCRCIRHPTNEVVKCKSCHRRNSC